MGYKDYQYVDSFLVDCDFIRGTLFAVMYTVIIVHLFLSNVYVKINIC